MTKTQRRKRRRRGPFLTSKGELSRAARDRQQSRENETPVAREIRMNEDRLRHHRHLDNESVEARENRLNEDLRRHQEFRDNESDEEREQRLEIDRRRHRQVYAEEFIDDYEDNAELREQRRHERQEARFRVRTRHMAAINEDEPEAPVPIYTLGPPQNICNFCDALYWAGETNTQGRFTNCCGWGKVVIPIITEYHPTMVTLLDHRPNDAGHEALRLNFLENIRNYNSILAMAGVQANFDRENFDNRYNNRWRPFVYKVHGAMYYNIPPMFNDELAGRRLQTAQYYMFDSDIANETRINNWRNNNGHCNRLILDRLEQMLHEVNPFTDLFYSNRQVLANLNVENPNSVAMYLIRANLNQLRNEVGVQHIMHREAVGGEIAAVFPDHQGLPLAGINLAVYPRLPNRRERINIRDPNADPLCFPLLFPYGEAGYDERLQHTRAGANNRVTLKEFAAHRLHIRDNNLNLMFETGKLFQEKVVSDYMKVESNNLNWIAQNQTKLRIEEYQGLMDRPGTTYTVENIQVGEGRAYILPATFEGSDRAMKQHYYDAMCLNKKYGSADLFCTKTANPNDPDIQRFLKPGQSFLDRPDICARVAEQRFREFMRDITKRHLLGVVDAFVWVKEYQKRGLPHWHCIFWLSQRDKLESPADIDRFITAEIPDPVTQPELHALVVKYMLHGPCFRNMTCRKNTENCAKGFPKPFAEHTVIRQGKFPQYRRRNNGRFVMKRGHRLTNQHVVPYNPYLLLKYQCHINVELVAFLLCLMYIFKYLCKGNDRVAVQLDRPVLNENVVPFDEPVDNEIPIQRNTNNTADEDEPDDYAPINVDNQVPEIPLRPTREQAYNEIRDYQSK